MKDSEDSNKFTKSAVHNNLEYLDFLEQCHDICSRIYVCRNISLNEPNLIEELKKIDKLQNHKCFDDEEY